MKKPPPNLVELTGLIPKTNFRLDIERFGGSYNSKPTLRSQSFYTQYPPV